MSAHGTFHWNELMSRDVERDKRFYSETIGWSFEPMPLRIPAAKGAARAARREALRQRREEASV